MQKWKRAIMLCKWCVLNFDRILGQNFPRMPFSLCLPLIVLDLCDVNRIFKRAHISRRPFSPFAFEFTSRKTVPSFFFIYLFVHSWSSVTTIILHRKNYETIFHFVLPARHERSQKLRCLIKTFPKAQRTQGIENFDI